MTKQKTRKELEEDFNTWKMAGIIFICFFVFMTIWWGFDLNKIMTLKQQLSECQEQVNLTKGLVHYYSFDCCQEQVEVWTLKFVCIEEDIKVTFEQNFTDYGDYELGLELVGDKEYKLFENCEVIE